MTRPNKTVFGNGFSRNYKGVCQKRFQPILLSKMISCYLVESMLDAPSVPFPSAGGAAPVTDLVGVVTTGSGVVVCQAVFL